MRVRTSSATGDTAAGEHVDAVVIGSGFGGAVSAFRLAEAGLSVVVLERGRAYPPGSFPRSPREMGRAFWDPEDGLHGLFDVWSFDGFESLVSSGLGGGSLIYANVLLRKDERWFVREEPLPGGGYETWPLTRADLDPHYDAVEQMLAPVPYPFDAAPYSDTPKTRAMQQAADRLGLDWQLPPLAVSFASRPGAAPEVGARIDAADYGNLHGVPRRTCRLGGDCDIGCNEGAKNSLDHTYLSAAAHHGADIRTLSEARGIGARDGGGYDVEYARHDADDPSAAPVLRRMSATRVVLAAGTFGTAHLLLSNRANLPGIGSALGTRFSGNGDLLTFLTPGEHERVFHASRGPVITSAVRGDDTVDGGSGRGFYLEDGGYPGFVDWMVEPVRARQGLRTAAFVADWLGRRLRRSGDSRLSEEVSRLIGDGSFSAGALPLLGMGRDVPDGVLALREDGRLGVEWTTTTSREYFGRVRETMAALADELGVRLRDNPLWMFRRVVTVHPLGGAPMGRDPATGVCDGFGEVFGHPGLYVADGSAMPGPVGTNPSLTIAAHADRMSTRILERRRTDTAAATRPRRSS
ncbi:FAD-dependent oxidoreductase (plasmid) [Pseudonocardia sp. EC080610-09]|uniref:GMC oxidoreductase n=1 Tax=unclassified Pseudonocardia TaxID=2619320 RepID=UPI00070671CF|nr:MULTISPECIES: GMC family oxidoreductase [unclassified Pseudonocardia]ALL79628.1 FAD-dependent oxidoreductase [Pseudonocardia sp. EC080610-09]ALL85415.1 FAD-dependent oxidoreductase [Pseudonocardia sp. EC080619-01]